MKSHRENSQTLRLGILGGGQLARMLALEAHRMGIEPWILSENKQDPAAQVSGFWTQGNPSKIDDLQKFSEQVDCLTFESEFLDASLLSTLDLPIHPSPTLMGVLQDRLTQKNLLLKHKIPTSPFVTVDTFEDLKKAFQKFPKGLVLKKRRNGYDGYGTFIVRKESDLDPLRENLSVEKSGFIAEAFIPFKRELAIILGRDQKGNAISLPLVESLQTNAKCDWVMGPIKHKKAATVIAKIKKMLTQEKYVGVIGFELFDTGSEILVNELAPRVHNSGHYSQNALSESQFTLHVKAVCGIECHSPTPLAPGFAMANLIGASTQAARWKTDFKSYLHWYGKSENRPGRKMGHLNAIAASGKKALTQVLKDRKKFSL